MKHQITNLFMAILVFAGIATSATKADEIEGTWIQDGQYKKFSKIFSNSILNAVSEDGKKMAFIVNDSLRIVEIATGILLDTCYLKADIPQNYTDEPSYSLSNNFSYVACRYNERYTTDTVFHYMEDLLIRKIANHKIILDTTITYTIHEVDINGSLSGISSSFSRLFISDSIYCSFLAIKAEFARRTEYNYKYSFAFNCTAKHKLQNTPFSNYSYIHRTNNGRNLLASCYTIAYDRTPYNGTTRVDENEYIFGYYNNIYRPISSRSWFYSNDPQNPGKYESNLNPIGITPDCKTAIISNSDREICLYNLVKAAPVIKLTDSTGNTKFPQIASPVVLFPNNVNTNKLLYISRLNQLTLFSTLNYFTGATNTFGCSNKDYIVNSDANFMIDSNKILSISDSKEIYILDLESVVPINNLDIYSDFQSASTNDTISFVAIHPESYRNILIDFGDGNTSNASNAKHKYSEMGKYTIIVTAEDAFGNEVKVIKEKYITINQGIEINIIPSISYESNGKIKIKAKAKIIGDYSNLNLYIKPANDVSQLIQTIEEDTIIGEFTGLGYYTIRVTCFDKQFNKFISKDTVLNIFGPSDSIILSENYTNTNVSSNVHLFKYSKGYQAFYHFYTSSYATSIDSNFQIKNQEYYKESAYYWSFAQLSDANYYLSMSTAQGGRFSIYDNRKPDPMNNLLGHYSQSGFGFNDDTLATIDKETNEIVLQSFKDITEIKRINTNVQFNSQPLVCNDIKNKKVFLIDNSTESGITLYGVNQNFQVSKINTIDAQYLPDYKVAQTLKSSKNNVFEFIDTNCVITLDFNTGTLHSLSIPNFNIQQVVHISDTTLALLGIDSASLINVCLVDSNYNEKERITLPYRTGNVLFAEKNKQNQLDFAARTPIGNLYFCTVKISNDTGSVIDTTNNGKLYLNEVSRFPNPASNSITIEYPLSSQASVSIVNESGRVYSSEIKSINADNFSIDTSLLPDGLYFVQIQDGEINKSIKFMVKR